MIKNLNIYISIFVYLICVCVFLPYTSYYFNSVDLAQYYSIALKYSTGNFSEALNLYWPPLFSWLLIPFISVFENPMLAAQVLNIFVGLFCLLIFFRFDFVKPVFDLKTLSVFIALPVCILSFALMYSGPDLLFATLLMLLIQLLYDEIKNAEPFKLKSVLLIAFTGGLLYLSKAMGFYIFIAVIIIYLILGREFNWKLILSLFGYFLFFSAPWILALSIKNGGITLGSNGAYNFELISPENFDLSNPVLCHPFFANKFVPFSKQGFCAWEWPNEALSGSSKISEFVFTKHYFKVILNNLKSIYFIFVSHNFGIIILLILNFVLTGKKFAVRNYFWFLLLAFLAPLILYSLIFVHYRYLYVVVLAALLFFVLVIDYSRSISSKGLQLILLSGIYLSMLLLVKRPVKEMLYKSEKDVNASVFISDVLHPVITLKQNYETEKLFYNKLLNVDKKLYNGKSFCGIKTNNDYTYSRYLEMAMLLNMKFYGEEISNEKTGIDLSLAKPGLIIEMDADGNWKVESYE